MLAQLARTLLALVTCSTFALAQIAAEVPDVFEKVDPHTQAKPLVMQKLGYVSFAPKHFYDQVTTGDVEDALEGAPLIWVETAHFKIGSNLGSYRSGEDEMENAALDKELKRFRSRLAGSKVTRQKLDPWLRLHLFAQRLEDQYDDFQRRFGLADGDAERAKKEGGPYMGEGPYLGLEQKFAVLLTDKQISVRRFAKQLFQRESTDYWQRFTTQNGAAILAISTELLGSYGYKLDSHLHAVVAGEMAFTFVQSFRKGGTNAPVWFRAGLAHVYARAADPRCTLQAVGVATAWNDPASYEWEHRVRAIVEDKSAAPWNELVTWTNIEAITPPQHLACWSRVAWMLERKGTKLHALLLGFTEDGVPETEAARKPIDEKRQRETLRTALELVDLEAADGEWKQYVLRKYAKK